MTQFVKFTSMALVVLAASFQQPVAAATDPALNGVATASSNSNFTVRIDQRGSDDALTLSIVNKGGRNLSVTLCDPTGVTVDNFFAGKKFTRTTRDYNFTGAEDGVYTLIIADGVQKIKKQIHFDHVPATPVTRFSVQ